MTKAIGLFNMFLCYGATIMCVCTTVHMIAFASEYVQAFFMALAGGDKGSFKLLFSF